MPYVVFASHSLSFYICCVLEFGIFGFLIFFFFGFSCFLFLPFETLVNFALDFSYVNNKNKNIY